MKTAPQNAAPVNAETEGSNLDAEAHDHPDTWKAQDLPTNTGGERRGWRAYFPAAVRKTLKRRNDGNQARGSFETLTARFAKTLAVLCFAFFCFAATVRANTYTVNTKADTSDGVCDAASCTLREAIDTANSNPGADTIRFNINGFGVQTIALLTALPAITDTVTINGFTQKPCASFPIPCSQEGSALDDAALLIELNGENLISAVKGALVINASNCVVRGLIINRFPQHGIFFDGAGNGATITGNFIGLNSVATTPLPNHSGGIFIHNASNITIGGVSIADRNMIAGNNYPQASGITIDGAAATANKVLGNYVGLNKVNMATPNYYGIRITNDAHGTVIGGTTSDARNVISGNDNAGILIDNAYNNTIQGNYIGVAAFGVPEMPNRTGIVITNNSTSNVIGGSAAGAGNVISGNKFDGIDIHDSNGNTVVGNVIGLREDGFDDIPNKGGGIFIDGKSQANKIGDFAAGSGNLISGNGSAGIGLSGDVSGTLVLRNLIGTTSANGVGGIPNRTGIVLSAGAHNNWIGSLIPNSGNVIAYNSWPGFTSGFGIFVSSTAGSGNAIRGNSIHDNSQMGIALGQFFVTENDVDDGDGGANNLQNFPVLYSAITNGGTTTVTGTLHSNPDTDFRIEFFASSKCDSTGHGEGETYLGATTVTTSGPNATFSAAVPAVNVGQFITATATNNTDLSTSEFSKCRLVTQPGQPGNFVLGPAYSVSEGASATISVDRVGGNTGAVSVEIHTTFGGTATEGQDYTDSVGKLTWNDGDAATKTFSLPIINDNIYEGDETVNLVLGAPTGGATLGNQSKSVLTIHDNDQQPAISINDPGLAEGNSGNTIASFTVTLSNPSSQQIDVDWGTASATASSGSDYQPAKGTLTFAAGETSKTVPVTVNGDTDIEPDEMFFIILLNPVNASLADGQGNVTIINDDGGPTVQFAQSNYSTQEELSFVTVTVTRSDASGPASVDYATSDGSATQKSDYEFAAGTLQFAPGESSKTITILINEDAYLEGNETFNIVLSNPSGASLGQQSSGAVDVNDDVPESATSPIDDVQSFVHMHYHDFLNREPDPAGLAFWINQIAACGNDPKCSDEKRTNVSASFFLSIEFQETGYLRYLLERESFGSTPKYSEFMRDVQEIGRGVIVNTPGWEQKLKDNQRQFADKWSNRPSFKAVYDPMSNVDYVNALYTNAGILPTQVERESLVNALEAGNESRAAILLDVAANAAFRQKENSAAFVMMQYFGYLRRDPNAAPDADMSGYNFWLNKLNQFGGNYVDAEMIKAFITSFEYRGRFAQ